MYGAAALTVAPEAVAPRVCGAPVPTTTAAAATARPMSRARVPVAIGSKTRQIVTRKSPLCATVTTMTDSQQRHDAQGISPSTNESDEGCLQRALSNYETFYGLPKGSATVKQVQNSCAGIRGWSNARAAAALKQNPKRQSGSPSKGKHAQAGRVAWRQLAKQAATEAKKEKLPQADLDAAPLAQTKQVELSMPVSPSDIPVPPGDVPICVFVNSMGGKTVEVDADSGELVAHLRRRIAKALNKPLSQLALACGTDVLHGTQLVGDVLGGSGRAEISAFLSQEGGPVEEWMDFDDPQQLAEYMPELYSGLKSRESKCKIWPKYMEQQTDINARMRAILVDWLVEVHMKYRLRTVTLFLAVNIIDRYLQANDTKRKRLQLVGIVSLIIASKFEEINALELKEVPYVSDNAYTLEEAFAMEAKILACLGFNLCVPSAAHFLDLYQRANRCDTNHCFVVQYLMELTLCEVSMVGKMPSRIAAAASLLSNRLLERAECWPAAMASYTGYSEDMLEDVVQEMRHFLASATTSSLQSVIRKFRHHRFGSVSSTLSP